MDERGGLSERAKALSAAQALVDAVAALRAAALERATREALQAASAGASKHCASLLGRCARRAAEASLALSRLRFCCASLAESARKQAESTELGLLDVAAEARGQRLTLQRQYEEAEGVLRSLLHEAAALRGEAAALGSAPSPSQAAQLAAALAQLAAADAEFSSREQPPRIQPDADIMVVMEPVSAGAAMEPVDGAPDDNVVAKAAAEPQPAAQPAPPAQVQEPEADVSGGERGSVPLAATAAAAAAADPAAAADAGGSEPAADVGASGPSATSDDDFI